MNATITKRSVLINGRKTSISLEDMFWHGLKDIAAEQQMSAAMLLVQIDKTRGNINFSSAVRQFVTAHYINLVSTLRQAPGGGANTRVIDKRSGSVALSPMPTTLG